MIALWVVLSWTALATAAFLALSQVALARTHGDLETDFERAEEPGGDRLRGEMLDQSLTARRPLVRGPRTAWTRRAWHTPARAGLHSAHGPAAGGPLASRPNHGAWATRPSTPAHPTSIYGQTAPVFMRAGAGRLADANRLGSGRLP
ncbi:MAG TPA: hypothetical protein VID29_09110 [Solirubrobacteraceae bacterium]|jgi:hypothetical protein